MKAALVGACIALIAPTSALADCVTNYTNAECYIPSRPMPGGGGGGGGGGDSTDWSAAADTIGSIIGTISEMAEDQRQQEQEDAARQPTELSTEEKLKEIEALKEKFRREADQEAKRELDKKTWWTDEDTREVEREIVKGLADHAAKVQLGSFIKESFGNGAQEAANLSDTAAEVLLNLKTGVSGAFGRVSEVKAGLKQDFDNWLDQLKNDIDKVN
ncbi:hypothetical protein HFO56_39455 [Rhizobium laguerreae]|uniref:hypothetical protein n=1 Tax=Rhizobium laguerreae TaxID=1076926 RepID=UPI001C914DF3|nr:hypothetical protein [Rhizobium laguerreae]MBY3158378.1 hypothetical protein [Rhizobium laguerreae]